jgi:hypothetical protein
MPSRAFVADDGCPIRDAGSPAGALEEEAQAQIEERQREQRRLHDREIDIHHLFRVRPGHF